ncbi:AraC family transcriptional regulator [Sorangium sp. So ce385]|uniref:AraC family transcriptional regulator n=1 Tax=Sorangium sp. So ce385 TaxID=3133308 RepID=UPI003F5BDBD9
MAADLVPLSRVLVDRVAALGVDAAALLRRAGVAPSQLEVARPVVTTREYFAFWRALGDLSPARDIGLRLGGEASPYQLDVATLAALHARTLGEALARLSRYKRLVCAEEVSVDVARGEARVGFHWIHAAEPLPHLLVECVFAALLDLAWRGSGERLVPLRVELSRRRADASLLRRHFGCALVFDAAVDRLVLDESALARPFRTQNAELCALLLPALDAAIDERLRSRSLVDDVRAALRRRLTGEPVKIDHIAGDVRLTPRTLQRRLVKAGTSYQALLDEVRRDAARRLLAATELGISEIAFLLGFAELNSFTRAFRGWEGTTPLRWRRAAFEASAARGPAAARAALTAQPGRARLG